MNKKILFLLLFVLSFSSIYRQVFAGLSVSVKDEQQKEIDPFWIPGLYDGPRVDAYYGQIFEIEFTTALYYNIEYGCLGDVRCIWFADVDHSETFCSPDSCSILRVYAPKIEGNNIISQERYIKKEIVGDYEYKRVVFKARIQVKDTMPYSISWVRNIENIDPVCHSIPQRKEEFLGKLGFIFYQLQARKAKDDTFVAGQDLNKSQTLFNTNNFKIIADSAISTLFKLQYYGRNPNISIELKNQIASPNLVGVLKESKRIETGVIYEYRSPSLEGEGFVDFVVKDEDKIACEFRCIVDSRLVEIFNNTNGEKLIDGRELGKTPADKEADALNGAKIAADSSKGTTIFKIKNKVESTFLRIKNFRNEDVDGTLIETNRNYNEITYVYNHPSYIDERNYIDFEVGVNGEDTGQIFRVFIVPPPLLLLHGLGGDGNGTWGTFKNFLINSTAYTNELIYAPNLPQCDHFDPNYNNVEIAINTLLETVITNKISAKKVDIAGHSMGGILARYHLNRKGSENINRLITCNTPHWGTGVANLADKFGQRSIARMLLQSKFDCNSLNLDAIIDLQLRSEAINKLYLEQTATVPSHAIYTTFFGIANCPDEQITNFALEGFSYLNAITTCTDFLTNGEKDGIVDIRSQKGGLTGLYVSGVGNQFHAGSVGNIQVMNKLLFLLQQSPNSFYYTKSGFSPPDLDFNAHPQTTIADIDLTLKFDPTLNEKKVTIGETIAVKITKGANISKVVFTALSDKGDSISFGYTQKEVPQFNYKIRSNFNNDTIRLLAVAKVGDTYIVDSVKLIVKGLSCPNPNTPAVSNIKGTSTTVSWGAVQDVAGYSLDYKTDASSTWTTVTGILNNSYNLTGLVPSTVYNVRVKTICSPTSFGDFSVVTNFTTLQQAVNDECVNAVNVPVNNGLTCTTQIQGTTTGATQSQAGCTGTTDDDVWYKFVAGNTHCQITIGNVTQNIVLEFFSGDCNNLQSLGCINSGYGDEVFQATGLTIGQTYYFRVYTYSEFLYGNFTVCVKQERPFPIGLFTCLEHDFRELEKLYDATGGNNWVNKANWFTNPDMATWYGVVLTPSSCGVQALFLNNNHLVGTLPPLNLTYLGTFSLYTNQLSGGVDNFYFPSLTGIDISDNPNWGGSLPIWANSPNLQYYYAARSSLTGSIPNLNKPNLRVLQLWDNQLSGNIPLFNLPNLIDLQLQNNQLTGSIPNFNMPNLELLQLFNNQLSGTIPNFNMPKLVKLYLNVNKLTGSIPNFNFPLIETLFLRNNELTGSIPNFNLPNLVSLSIRNNHLSGSVPDFNLPKLNQLRLDTNDLSGIMPNFSNCNFLSGGVATLRLDANKFLFGDLEGKPWLNISDIKYTPQAKILITLTNGLLTVNTGTVNNSQQFEWYKNDVLVTTNQSNTFSPTGAGKYYCKVRHNILTVASDINRNLVLQSEDYIVGTIIPVELLNFTATPLSKTTQLNWQTASEKNANYFDVEQSYNGKTFDKIGEVKANGNSATLKTYSFIDETPFNGLNYYRLRQVDEDGTATLSNIVSVTFNTHQKLTVFPNPTKDKLTIISESIENYSIIDVLGHEILRGVISGNQTDVDVSTLPAGMYLVKTKTESIKFSKN